MSDTHPDTTAVGALGPLPIARHGDTWNCVSREEHERAIQESFDRGYNAGKADAYMDEAYANGDIDTPEFDDARWEDDGGA